MKQFRAFLATLLFASVAIGATQRKIPEGFIAGSSSVGTTAAPNSKSVLDVVSTTKGLLIPRMTTTQRGNISSPAEGLLVWDTDINSLFQYTGSAWVQMSSTSATETLTNKTLTSAELDTALADDGIDFNEEASLSSPSAGKRRLGVKSDGKLYLRNSSGTETEVGSGAGGGGKSYVTTGQGDGETSATTGWALYCDTAGLSPEDGTGGTTTNLTFAQTTAAGEVLRQTGSYKFTKNAANRQGCGFSYDFTIERQDQVNPKMITIDFGYQVSTNFSYGAGTASSPSDVVVYIYDRDNGVLIQPTPFVLDGSGKFTGTFQAISSSNDYRLILHTAGTGTSSWDFIIDGSLNNAITIGPLNTAQGPPVTDWQTWTPTGSWTGGNVTYTGSWRRVGGVGEYVVHIALTGAPTGSTLTVNLPSGQSIDSTYTGGVTNQRASLGRGGAWDSDASQPLTLTVKGNNTTSVSVNTVATGAASSANETNVNATTPVTWASGDSINIHFTAPIAGWGGGSDVSELGYGARVIGFRAYNPNQGAIANSATATLTWATEDRDDVDAHSGGTYTVKEAGWYEIKSEVLYTAACSSATNSVELLVRKNGATVLYENSYCLTTSNVNHEADVGGLLYLLAGDTISVVLSNATGVSVTPATSSFGSYLSMFRVAGPTTIMPGEKVVEIWGTAAAQEIDFNSFEIIDYGTAAYSSHGAVTTGASWKFTSPRNDCYTISAQATFNGGGGTWAAGEIAALAIYKNGSGFIQDYWSASGSLGGNEQSLRTGGVVCLNAGEYIDVRLYQTGDNSSGWPLLGTAVSNTISIISR